MGEQTFEQEVLESTTPVLVHFGAPWCGPCRMIEPLLIRFQSEWNRGFKFIGINADENLKLSSHYRITTLPTILFFQGGKVIYRLEGLYKRDDLQVELQKFMGGSLQTSGSAVSAQPLKPLRS